MKIVFTSSYKTYFKDNTTTLQFREGKYAILFSDN